MIVERTSEIYGTPINSLSISKDTSLIDEDGNKLSSKGIALYSGFTLEQVLELEKVMTYGC